MTYEELTKALKEGKAIAKKLSPVYIKVKDGKLAAYRKSDDEFAYTIIDLCLNVVDMLLKDKTPYEIYEKPILDKVERKYLSDVIRPFRRKYKILIVKTCSICNEEESICIRLINHDVNNCLQLPWFTAGEMYKGMKAGKGYTLEELGL